MQFPAFSGWTCIFPVLYSSWRKRGRELIHWVRLNIFGFLWKNKLKVILQIQNCFWDEFWKCPPHTSVWYQNTNLRAKGMLLGFHYPPKCFSWPTEEMKQKLKYWSGTGTQEQNLLVELRQQAQSRTCLFLLSDFTTGPVILHSGAAFYRQGECPVYCCKRQLAHGTHRHARSKDDAVRDRCILSKPEVTATTPGADITHYGYN